MFKLSKLLTGLFIAIGFSLIADGAAVAQSQNNSKGQQRAADTPATGRPVAVESLTFNSAFEVKQIFVRAENNTDTRDSSSAAPLLKIAVKDIGFEGDRWSHRSYCAFNGETWDVRGVGRGDTINFTGETTVYRTGPGPQPIECLVEIRYAGGISDFPAGMSVRLSVPTGYTLTTTIQSTLVPLPSM